MKEKELLKHSQKILAKHSYFKLDDSSTLCNTNFPMSESEILEIYFSSNNVKLILLKCFLYLLDR